MTKKIKQNLKKCLLLIIIAIIIYFLFFGILSKLRMLNLPKGEYLDSLVSPNGNYTLNSYRYSGGATVDWHLRVEVVNKKNDKKTNIYWVYHEKDAKMKWIDNKIVEINGRRLNIHKDYYNK